jgi:S1-C subfamily serine protease
MKKKGIEKNMKQTVIALIILVIGLFAGSQLDVFDAERFSQDSQQQGNESIVETPETVIPRVVDQTLPSVVTIGIREAPVDQIQRDPFNPFGPFGRIPGQEQEVERNIGSGFIVSSEGLIITNKHVVANTEAEYEVLTNDKKEYEVERIYRDPLNDLAILDINATGLNPLKLGDSSNLDLGETVVAIGTPLGEFTNTVTSGIISGLGRGIVAGNPVQGFVEQLDNVIQTDAAINPGNSGGPLVDLSGQVIGVNTAVAARGQNIGFAIPVKIVKELLNNFEARGGSFERPFIGVRYQMIDRETALLNNAVAGAYIVEVIEGSPASDADLQRGDIITDFDGKNIQNAEANLTEIILKKESGDTVGVKLWRDGEVLQKQLTIGKTDS